MGRFRHSLITDPRRVACRWRGWSACCASRGRRTQGQQGEKDTKTREGTKTKTRAEKKAEVRGEERKDKGRRTRTKTSRPRCTMYELLFMLYDSLFPIICFMHRVCGFFYERTLFPQAMKEACPARHTHGRLQVHCHKESGVCTTRNARVDVSVNGEVLMCDVNNLLSTNRKELLGTCENNKIKNKEQTIMNQVSNYRACR